MGEQVRQIEPGALLAAARSARPRSGRAAVIGSPIAHSLSPLLHQAAYASLGLTGWGFERHEIGAPGGPGLAEFLAAPGGRPGDGGAGAGADGPPWRGLAVTMPLKEAALDLAVARTRRAARLGAANTLIPVAGGWAADNTDSAGLRDALRENGLRQVGSAVLLGSGATARAALGALAELGATAVCFAVRDRVRPRTASLAAELGMSANVIGLREAGPLTSQIARADVTISALPHGTSLLLPPAGPAALGHVVLLDVVYGGWPSPLASWAAAGGARVVSGLPMLLHQAVEQVRLMTGRTPGVAAMRAALRARTGPDGW